MTTKQERINRYVEFMDVCADCIEVADLDAMGFFDAPASLKYHGAYDGGLFEHSLETATALVKLTEKLGLRWETPESARIVGMYHDLCKCNNYVRNPDTGVWEHNDKSVLPGHGDKSVIITQQFLELTGEEVACIRWHMGAYETDTRMWNYYGRAVEMFPNVLYTHTADMIASHITGV
jgi:putative nucleotidyltransferase with HDIG domain